MTCELIAGEIQCLFDGETRNGAVNWTNALSEAELLNSTTLTEIGSSDLTIAPAAAVNLQPLLIEGQTAIPGKAVTFGVTGGTPCVTYELLNQVVTSLGQTMERVIRIEVR